MKAWIQRVARASVTIDGERVAEIGRGYLVLLGVTHTDTEAEADKIASRLPVLRLFTDANDQMNLSLEDVGGSIIVVSQFTLYADTEHGTPRVPKRPSRCTNGSSRSCARTSARNASARDASARTCRWNSSTTGP